MSALDGLRVVELAGIGPAPHAAMYLADHGAEVVRVERPGTDVVTADPMLRGRTVVEVDLKSSAGLAVVLALADRADVLLEGFRPGVVERLGLGPEVCLARNPSLVFARITGWGQEGPLASRAGHDINYIALTGALSAIGTSAGPPSPPLNLVGDYGGGSMLAVAGILTALLERSRSGGGQVVDAAMVDGASLLMQQMWSLRAAGDWSDERRSNLLDGGAPFYATYRCADGRFVAVGAMEPQFFAEVVRVLGLDSATVPDQEDRGQWPVMRRMFEVAFGRRARDEWVSAFDGVDACVAPVLTLSEVPRHEHVRARQTVPVTKAGHQAAPAPRLSRSAAMLPGQARWGAVSDVVQRWSTNGCG